MESKPWLQHYDEGVPHTLEPYPQRTLLDVMHDTAVQRPDHTALIFKGARLSYAALDRLSDAFAAALVSLGAKKGDRVALLLPNCPQTIVCQFGAWKVGAVVTPINPLYTERELEHTLQAGEAEIAVVLTPFYGKLKAIQAHTRLRCIVATNIKEYLPPLLRLLFTLAKEKKRDIASPCRPAISGCATCCASTPALLIPLWRQIRMTRPSSCSPAAPPAHPKRRLARTRRC